MGRRKIEMKLVRDSSSRQVTFSKRRSGVFKKANELVTLCGAEVAIITFSPGGKPFSFGQPSVDAVADRFLHRGSTRSSRSVSPKGTSANNGMIEKLSQQLTNLMSEVQEEKKKGKTLDKTLKKNKLTQGKLPLEGLDSNELRKLKKSLKELKVDVEEYVRQLEASSCLMLLAEKAVDMKGNRHAAKYA